MATIKCISLWQPWASLVALGEKRIETRRWHPGYHGPIAIHAAKFYSMETAAFANSEPCRSVLRKHGLEWGKLPRGAVVAVANLEWCVLVDRFEAIKQNQVEGLDAQIVALLDGWSLTDQERALGDFSFLRFAWLLADVRPLATPIPTKGRQGLFSVDIDIPPAIAPAIDGEALLAANRAHD